MQVPSSQTRNATTATAAQDPPGDRSIVQPGDTAHTDLSAMFGSTDWTASGSEPKEEQPETTPRKPLRRRLVESWAGLRDDFRSVDWEIVRTLLLREGLITLRSREWTRLLTWYTGVVTGAALVPGLYRTAADHWLRPSDRFWLRSWTLLVGLLLVGVVAGWTRRRMSRELKAGTTEEILLTSSCSADLMLGKAIGTAALAVILSLATAPGALLISAVGGATPADVARLLLTLALAAYLGLSLGMEMLFAAQGGFRLSSFFWNFFYLFAVLANGLSSWLKWDWLRSMRTFCVRYNPISTLLAAGGWHRERWGVGMLVLLGIALLFTLANYRLLRGELAQPGPEDWLTKTLRHLFGFRRRLDLLGKKARVALGERPFRFGADPVGDFDTYFGTAFRVSPAFYAPFVLLLLVPAFPAATGVYALALLVACLVAGQNGCAAVVEDRRAERWGELALLPYTDDQLARSKLAYALRSWRTPGVVAVLAVLAGTVWGGWQRPEWIAWALLTAVTLPPACCLVGAYFGLRSPTPAEAPGRVWGWVLLPPLLLTLGTTAGIDLSWASALSPLYGAVLAAFGPLPAVAWVGTLLWTAAGLAIAIALRTRLRVWALGEG